MISSEEFNDYGGLVNKQNRMPAAEAPLPYTKGTSSSFGRATAWRRTSGMGISKQSAGSFLSFDDDNTIPKVESDKGASFGKA